MPDQRLLIARGGFFTNLFYTTLGQPNKEQDDVYPTGDNINQHGLGPGLTKVDIQGRPFVSMAIASGIADHGLSVGQR